METESTQSVMERATTCGVSFSFKETESIVDAYVRGHMKFGDSQNSPQLLVLIGRHGVGKTSLLRQTAKRHKTAYASFHGGAIDSQDNPGLPDKLDGKQIHLEPAHIPIFHAPTSKSGFGIFVIEEMASNTNTEFQNQLRQLTEGQLGELQKHPNWMIMGTTNPPTAEYLTVVDIDEALARRVNLINMETTVEEVFGYISRLEEQEGEVFFRRFHQFLLLNPDYIHSSDPRTVFRLASMLQRFDFSETENGIIFKFLKSNSTQELAQAYEEFKRKGNNPDLYPILAKDFTPAEGEAKTELMKRIKLWVTEGKDALLGATKLDLSVYVKNALENGASTDDKEHRRMVNNVGDFLLAIGNQGYAEMANDVAFLFRDHPSFKILSKRIQGTPLAKRIMEMYNQARKSEAKNK